MLGAGDVRSVGETYEEEPGLMAHIVSVQQAATRQLEQVTSAHGIAFNDYLVIAIIRRSPGGTCAPSTLSSRLHRTTGGMTLTLDRLEDAGWLTRERGRDDRRRVVLRLTEKGHDLAVAANRSLHAWQETISGPDQRQSIVGALKELLDLLGSDHPHQRGSTIGPSGSATPTSGGHPDQHDRKQ